MSLNRRNFIECENKPWFEKLSAFTKASMVYQLERASLNEYGVNYEEYQELKHMKND